MIELLSTFLSMTGAVAATAAFIIVVRLILKNTKTPKWMLCALWLVVLFRMMCPMSFNTGVSIFNLRIFHNIDTAYKSTATTYLKEGRAAIEGSEEYELAVGSGVEPMDVVINGNDMGFKAVYYLTGEDGQLRNTPTLLEKYGSLIETLGVIWITVAALLFAYCIISWVLLKNKLCFAIRLDENIYESNAADTSLVLGFISPKIYLASGMTERQKEIVLEHERTHIRRLDHIFKPVFYLCCCLHWFNPLCWISYFLLCADIEIACDETVVKKLGHDAKAKYGDVLVGLSTKRSILPLTVPLSFGESAVKNRLDSILRTQTVTKLATGIAALVCAVCVLASVTNAVNDFAPIEVAYDSHLMIEYGIGVTEEDVRYLTSVEQFMYEQPPELYYDAEFTERIIGSLYSNDPGLGITTARPAGGTYTFSSDLQKDEAFYIRAPVAAFRGSIEPEVAVFDAEGNALATINGEPWMELTMNLPKEDGNDLPQPLRVSIRFLKDGIYPLSNANLTLSDGGESGIFTLSYDGQNGNYWFTGGEMKFTIIDTLVQPEGAYIIFSDAAEYIVETAVPTAYFKGGS